MHSLLKASFMLKSIQALATSNYDFDKGYYSVFRRSLRRWCLCTMSYWPRCRTSSFFGCVADVVFWSGVLFSHAVLSGESHRGAYTWCRSTALEHHFFSGLGCGSSLLAFAILFGRLVLLRESAVYHCVRCMSTIIFYSSTLNPEILEPQILKALAA